MSLGASIDAKYELLAKLAEGGMGAVYLVRHRYLEELRVIKTMRSQLVGSEQLTERFLREARTATRLNHRNIAKVYDFAIDEEAGAYMVIEHIDGVDLEGAVELNGPISLGLGLEVAQQTLAALDHLHTREIVHRDISADNLMLTRTDGELLVKLIDLGVAKNANLGAGITSTGVFLGKLEYAAPEQLADGASIDARADLYALSVVLYSIFSGGLPFTGNSPSAVIAQQLSAPVARLPLLRDGKIPAELVVVLTRGLAKKPEERYATAKELASALAGIPVQRAPKDELTRLLSGRRRPPQRSVPTPTIEVARSLRTSDPGPAGDTLRIMPNGQLVDESTTKIPVQRPAEKPEKSTPPRPMPSPKTPPPERLEGIFKRLVEESEGLAQSGKLERALDRLEDAEALIPDQDRVRDLRASFNERLETTERLRRAEAALSGAETDVAELLEGDEVEAARERLAGLEVDPNDERFQALVKRIERAEARVRRQRLSRLKRRASELERSEQLVEAAELLREALEIDQLPGIVNHLEALERRINERRERLERSRELADAATAVEVMIRHGRLEAAQTALSGVRERFGTQTLVTRLDHRVSALTERHLDRQRNELVEKVFRQLRGWRYEEALATLEEAKAGGTHEPRLVGVETLIRSRWIEDGLVARLDHGQIDAAREDYDRLKEQLGELSRISLGLRLELLEWRRRELRIDTLVAEAWESLGAEKNTDATRLVGEIQQLDPGHPEVPPLKATIARQQAEATIRRYLETDEIDSARHALEVAEKRFGSSPSLEALRSRLEGV